MKTEGAGVAGVDNQSTYGCLKIVPINNVEIPVKRTTSLLSNVKY